MAKNFRITKAAQKLFKDHVQFSDQLQPETVNVVGCRVLMDQLARGVADIERCGVVVTRTEERGIIMDDVTPFSGQTTAVYPKTLVAGFPTYHVQRVKFDDDGKRRYSEHPRLKSLRNRAREQEVMPALMMTKHVFVSLINRGHKINVVGGDPVQHAADLEEVYKKERAFLNREFDI